MIPPSELIGSPLPQNDLTINELWLRNVRDYESTLALICTHQAPNLYDISNMSALSHQDKDSYLRWTYGDLERAIKIFARGLRRHGLKEGDTLLTFTSNCAEFVISTWAAYRIGLIHVPLNPKNLSYDQEVQHMLDTAIASSQSKNLGVIAGSADLCEAIDKLTAGINCMKILVEVKGSETGWTPYEDLMQDCDGIQQGYDCSEHNMKAFKPKEQSLFFTSGTTSLPKGCLLQTSTYPFTVANNWRQGDMPMLPGNKFTLALPNNHAFGYMCLMSCFVNAATVIFPGPVFDPETMTQAIQKEQCEYTALVPTMVLALSLCQKSPTQKLSSLRRVILAGAPPTEEVVRTCLEDLGALGVQNHYGMTEGVLANTRIACTPSDIIAGGDVILGKPLPGAKIRICAQDSTVPLPAGDSGEMHFSGPTLVERYLAVDDDDHFYVEENGDKWFRTGDKAFIGTDGQLYLVGRFKETIIRGGENVEPSAIEATICQDPEFYSFEPQIVKCPDQIAGEVPVAVINKNIDKDTEHRLMERVSDNMGALYVPASVISLQSLGLKSFPRTMGGKIQKKRLEELVCERNRLTAKSSSPVANQNSSENVLGSQIVASLLSALEQHRRMPIHPPTRMIDLGVDSITSIAINHQVRKETGVSLPPSVFFAQTSFEAISERLSPISDPMELLNFSVPTTEEPPELCFSTLLQGTPKSEQPALFLLPPGSGYAFSYEALPKFSNDIAVYSLGSPFFMTKSEGTWSVEEASAIYARTIQHIQPQGPYMLSGWSMGAIIAYEVAFQLSQQGKRILGVINLDMGVSRPLTIKIPEPSVELFKIIGFYPPIHRKGQPDMEIPGYRKRHSISSFRAKMRYSPRPMSSLMNAGPVRIFIIWAAHGDHDRLLDVIHEADQILKQHGPDTELRADGAWLRLPRERFDSGGWGELVGEKNVDFQIVKGAAHDTMMDPGIVDSVAANMEMIIDKWLSQPCP
ncbi:NRPS-like protein biosynthetic cluster [Penicillium citrinum]|uniref:NRPS-like protein biosynthetic cluster n=1 Tax=Penicillium citrinum TaxID=5077 RepID=A0A9W9PGV4_PENCI|nr:NRPS-like protein biosynthetic cluster [Penicillium citrinum]KAJ5243417.1 NRPS-like protein biosynthetic cluster [Penicillium citrinum]KAK5806017.1 hypothetical protein VI817_000275 [Penicillium citrinum]